LCFKWIKQNLRIKAFFGTSDNAVKTQLWIAVCVYLLVASVPTGWRKRLRDSRSAERQRSDLRFGVKANLPAGRFRWWFEQRTELPVDISQCGIVLQQARVDL